MNAASDESRDERTELAENAALPEPADPETLIIGGSSNHQATDLTLVTPDGEVISEKDLITAVGSGDLDFRSFRIDESGPNDAVEIHLDCDIATVSYRSEMDVVADPLHFRHDSRHTDTWIRSGSSWKQLRGHTTAVGGFPHQGSDRPTTPEEVVNTS